MRTYRRWVSSPYTHTRIAAVLETRGSKQTWLCRRMTEWEASNGRVYTWRPPTVCAMIHGKMRPTRQFVEAACAVLALPEDVLFFAATDGREITQPGSEVQRAIA